WVNEYEADLIGYHILQDLLNHGVNGTPEDMQVMMRFAPLLYMEFIKHTENAHKIIEDGVAPPTITTTEQKAILDILQKKLTSAQIKTALDNINNYWLRQEHPPSEIRALYIREMLNETFKQLIPGFDSNDRALFYITNNLIYSQQMIYDKSEFAFFQWHSMK